MEKINYSFRNNTQKILSSSGRTSIGTGRGRTSIGHNSGSRSSYMTTGHNYNYYRNSYITGVIFFINIDNYEYISLNYGLDATQYCPLKNCNLVNETTIATPLRGKIKIDELFNNTQNINTKNATFLSLTLKQDYGCSIDFNKCLEKKNNSNKLIFCYYNFFVIFILFFYFLRN